MFAIKNKEKALECYSTFHNSKQSFEGAKTVLFLNKPEEIFVKYGDIKAELYEKEKKEYEEQ